MTAGADACGRRAPMAPLREVAPGDVPRRGGDGGSPSGAGSGVGAGASLAIGAVAARVGAGGGGTIAAPARR
jgi:hypothetical protein